MKVKALYFASLRDSTNMSEEMVETNAKTINELFSELNQKYNFLITKENLRVAKNEEYVDFDSQLSESDTIVFIPPVAGG